MGANRLAVWANAAYRKPALQPPRLPTVDLGVFDQRERLRVEVDFRSLLPHQAVRGDFAIKAVRGECRFDLKALQDGEANSESGTHATLDLATGELSQVYYDRFDYLLEIPVQVINEGAVAAAGLLLLTIRKPLVTQYPSMHFGTACRTNAPAKPRSYFITGSGR